MSARVDIQKEPTGVSMVMNFDPNRIFVPMNASAYYELVDYFFTYTIAGVAITKKAEFIVSGLKIRGDTSEGEQYAEKVVRKLDFKNKIVRMAMYYFAHGLVAMYPMPKVRKTLICKSCKQAYTLDKLHTNHKPQYRYMDTGEYVYKCTNKSCKKYGRQEKFKLLEEEVGDISEYNLAVWPPHQLSCINNSVTDRKMWMYKCDNETTKLISERNHYTISSTPENFLQAAIKGNRVIVDPDRIYVMEYPAMCIKGIPIPPMVAAFQDLYQRQIYQRANRQIAEDLLIPLRMLFPIWKGEGGTRPLVNTMNMEDWARQARNEIEKWKKDKSHVPIMPVEIGSKNIWGEGKLLVLGDNLRANMQDVCADLGTPLEFIYGGATWSRQNVSAITLENVLRSFSNKLSDPVGMIEDKINKTAPKDQKVTIRLDVPRLVDSMTELSILGNLEANKKYSSRSYMKDMGRDYDEEERNLSHEAEAAKQKVIDAVVNNAVAQVEAERILMKIEGEKRKANRVETLKDSLATRAIERDQMMSTIAMQEYQYEKQMEVQRKALSEQAKIQNKQIPAQLETMKAQLAINEESQIRMAKKMQKLQTLGIKKQIKAQYKAQQELQEAEQKKAIQEQQQQAVAMMSDKEKAALATLPPDKQSEMVQMFMEKARMRQVYEQMPPGIKQEMEDLPEEERYQIINQYSEELSKEEGMEESIEADEKLKQERVKQELEGKLKEEDVQRMAITYNKLNGPEREAYKAEIMQEDAATFARVKDAADEWVKRDYLTALLNGNDKNNKAIWKIVAQKNPDIMEELMAEYAQQVGYRRQASNYAYQLAEANGTPQYDAIMKELRESAPPEFRQMVIAEYRQLMGNKQEIMGNDMQQSETKVMELVEALNALPEKDRDVYMEEIKQRDSALYNSILINMEGKENELS